MVLYEDWLFFEGDTAEGYREDLAEEGWKTVQIPHDWAVSRPVNPNMAAVPEWTFGPQAQGYLDRWGIGWYRRHFVLPEKKEGKRYFLRFDGVFERCKVYWNEAFLGEHHYGYSGFSLEVTEQIRQGENIIAVRVDNSLTITDRWYSGCGIYRNVELTEVPEIFLRMEDVQLTADYVDGKGRLTLQVDQPSVYAEIDGVFEQVMLEGEKSVLVKENLDIRPWSAEAPNLYTLKLSVPGHTLSIPIGFRHVEWIPEKGMFVNGAPVKMKGVCLHHDAGCVGSAVTKPLLRKRLELLKKMGCNAIRTSHNIASADMMDLCDEMGFYVLDECFDKWVQGAYSRFYETDWESDLSYLILRDRNRPSVVMWSVGNEIEDQGSAPMLELLRKHCDTVRSMDKRPVTLAMSPHYQNLQGESVEDSVEEKIQAICRIAEIVDVIGCNYQEQWYEAIHEKMPKKLILGTEVYLFFKGSYNHYFNYSTENPWMDVERKDYVIGGCLWAGVDYLGESMGYPSKGWAGALIHENLVRKPISYLWESYWKEEPMVHISILDYTKKAEIVREPWAEMPLSDCWNFPMFTKMPMPYMIFSNCEEVRLSLNGKYFDIEKPSECKSQIITGFLPLETGRVLVEGMRDGQVVCTHELITSGPSAKLEFVDCSEREHFCCRPAAGGTSLVPDTAVPNPGCLSDDNCLSDTAVLDAGCLADDSCSSDSSCLLEMPEQLLFTVAAMDREGNLNPRESAEVYFVAEGPCVIEGVDNGYLCSLEPFVSDRVHMYQGKATVVLRVTGAGRIVLHAFADGMQEAVAEIC